MKITLRKSLFAILSGLVISVPAQGGPPVWVGYMSYPAMGYNPQATPANTPINVNELSIFAYTTTVSDKDTFMLQGSDPAQTQQFMNDKVSMTHTITSGTVQGQITDSYDPNSGVRTHLITIKAPDVSQVTVFTDTHVFKDNNDGPGETLINDDDKTAYTNVTVNPIQGSGD